MKTDNPKAGDLNPSTPEDVSTPEPGIKDVQGQINRRCRNSVERLRLFDEALDSIGSGRSQFTLFIVATMAFFVESAEMAVMSLLYPQLMTHFNVTEEELSVVPSCTAIGMLFGSVILGQLSDIKGRKFIFQISITICVLFGFVSSFASSIEELAFWRLLLGFGYGGNLVSATPLLLESLPSKSRSFYSALTGVGWIAGSAFSLLLGFLFLESKGWAWVLRLIALAGIPAVAGLAFTTESIRFLIMTKKYDEAIIAFEKMCKSNKADLPEYFNIQNLKGEQEEEDTATEGHISGIRKKIRQLGSRETLRTLVPLTLIWFTQSFASTIFPFFPLFVETIGNDVDLTFESAFAVGCGDILGFLIQLVWTHRLRRIIELRGSLLIIGAGILLIGATLNNLIGVYFLLAIAKGAQNPMYHALYTYSPEVFPTQIRVAAFGVCQFFHRLAPVLAPLAVTKLHSSGLIYATSVFGSLFLVASIMTFALKVETANTLLVESGSDTSKHEKIIVPDLEISSEYDPNRKYMSREDRKLSNDLALL